MAQLLEEQGHAQLSAYAAEMFRLFSFKEGKATVAQLMEPQHSLFEHVATYMITYDGGVVVQKRMVKPQKNRKTRVPQYQAFGGCKHPNNIFRMINSLRLELMDESSFVPQMGLMLSFHRFAFGGSV